MSEIPISNYIFYSTRSYTSLFCGININYRNFVQNGSYNLILYCLRSFFIKYYSIYCVLIKTIMYVTLTKLTVLSYMLYFDIVKYWCVSQLSEQINQETSTFIFLLLTYKMFSSDKRGTIIVDVTWLIYFIGK